MMRRCQWIVACLVAGLWLVVSGTSAVDVNGTTDGQKSDQKKFHDLTVQLENYFKSGVKTVTRSLLPNMMSFSEDQQISGPCIQSLMKYIMALSRAKMWAVQMLDASSKLPSGILIGTFADFGSFDECLDVEVLRKDGALDFRGSSCAIEMKPPMPPVERKTSLAKIYVANGEDTLGAQFREAYRALSHKHLKFIVCVPSTCPLEDIRHIAKRITNETDFQINVPKCYVKEEAAIHLVHIVVVGFLGILLILGVSGSVYEIWKRNSREKNSSMKEKVLISFALSSNFKRFVAPSGGATELKCIHGIRAFAVCYVILGHSYVYMDFEILKDPINIQTWFGTLSFELIHNGWLGVEVFFLLSGILVTYSGLKSMVKTGGRLNLPLLILRRYLRLTPSVLLLIGLVFFLPLLSSGPFWYHHVDPPIQSCRNYWWTTILYFSNWWGIKKGCLETTWYLAADFQLHILSLFLLIIFFRYAKATFGILVVSVLLSCVFVGTQTWFWDLGATIHLSTGDNVQVLESVNRIHIQTFTHLGPHCIGMIVGYYIFKYKEKKISKTFVILGWCAAITAGLSAILGNHSFVALDEESQALTILYAALHRCAFTCGIAWVLLACITGNGGPVNALLSSPIMAPVSRLTYMIYLIHPLVIWTKLGSLRERPFASHYDFVYLYITNVVISILVAIPFYLLLEAPLSNLERLLTNHNPRDEATQKTMTAETNGVTLTNVKLQPSNLQLPPNHITFSEKSNS